MEKIKYSLVVVYKYSLLDMTFSFRIKGHILYHDIKYYIDAMKTHNGPVFHFEYFESKNKKMENIIQLISPILIGVIDKDLSDNGPIQYKEYTGEIEIPQQK